MTAGWEVLNEDVPILTHPLFLFILVLMELGLLGLKNKVSSLNPCSNGMLMELLIDGVPATEEQS